MSWEFPTSALQVEVVALLAADATAANDEAAPHGFGHRAIAAHGKPPRYVWLPTRSREVKAPVSRHADEVAQISSVRLHCEVQCWGSSYAQAWALVNNLVRALNQAASADIRVESMRWLGAGAGEAWNQDGQACVLEFSQLVPTIDEYVALGTLADPAPSQILPDAYTGQTQSTDDLEVDGEAGPLVDTTDPP